MSTREKALSSKVVWTDKNPANYDIKVRTRGRGHEEEFSGELRRGSPTVSAEVASLLSGIASCLNLHMTVADMTRTSSQWKGGGKSAARGPARDARQARPRGH